MKPRMKQALAMAFAALAVPLASAQPALPQPDYHPNPSGSNPDNTFVEEPTASASKTEGAEGELAKPLVEALNADASLKGSKITVLPEKDTVTLTGSAATRDQVKRAGDIAAGQVGQGNVINTIQSSQM
jgi:BON domain-containing protein